jgi:hypothetical protein
VISETRYATLARSTQALGQSASFDAGRDLSHRQANVEGVPVMRKIVLLTVFAVLGVVAGVAQADRPSHPQHPAQAQNGAHKHSGHHDKSNPKSCATHTEGFNAVGSLVSAALTPATGHHRYSGTIVVKLTRVNHRAGKGQQSFMLTDARVVLHHGVDATDPAAGSRVGLHGKITELSKPCSTSSVSPTVTVRDVDIRKAKTAKP